TGLSVEAFDTGLTGDQSVTDHVEVAIGTEGQAAGSVQSAARGEVVEERSGRAVVAFDLVGEGAADVEVAIRPEDKAHTIIQSAAACGEEVVGEHAGRSVVTLDLAGVAAGDVEVAVGSVGKAVGAAQTVAVGEVAQVGPSAEVIALDFVGAKAAYQQ